MHNPSGAIETLLQRLDTCYDKYIAISALRYHFPKLFTAFEGSAGHMPIRDGIEVPEFLRHYGTTWMIISENGEAFVMDCGSPGILKQIQRLKAQGEISDVTEFWITHYHDDHVDAIPAFQENFPCTTRTDSVVADVVENPRGFRLPCISPAAARIDHRTQDGDSWTWNEFEMTAYHFPARLTITVDCSLRDGVSVCSSPAILLLWQALMITALEIATCSVKVWDMIGASLGLLNFNRLISSTATYRVPSLLRTERFGRCARILLKGSGSMQIFFRGTIPTTGWTNTGCAPTLTSKTLPPAKK